MPAKVIGLVDDEPLGAELYETFFSLQGYEVRAASSGQAGLVLVECEALDILLLDLILPDMHGFELLRRVRALPAANDLPVIVFTARDDPSIKDAALAAGADAFMPKPIMLHDLLLEIERLLPGEP